MTVGGMSYWIDAGLWASCVGLMWATWRLYYE